ncbi:N-acetyltransferase [Achromobacter seleniivolatilans]|uniref:N-acetyltransferase n=1 Tax=Achromobacter seleniivolatilans TaxID=3047478 RepID=A0ABY9M1Q5_9BURK|nr:N-acetyltransferase [Achromobacter sp. R39]WMD20932.1 N-acetyltransferase [Achromobacter sp. R39]
MPTLALHAVRHISRFVTELRIDVNHAPHEVEKELDAIHNRMNRPSDRLHGLPEVKTDIPGIVLRYREADGEYYVYVVDVQRDRVAGYTVFNRLIEVGKRADPYVRAPHSKYSAPYQGMGLATAVYRWALEAGLCIISGARQSTGAHRLWMGLARDYELGYVEVRRKQLSYLGPEVQPQVLEDLHTRMILLGQGWTLAAYKQATGMARLKDAISQHGLG